MPHAHGEAIAHAASATKPPRSRSNTLTYVDDVIGEAYLQLHRGNLDAFLSLHQEAGIRPRREALVSWGRKALWRGELGEALRAFAAARTRANRDDLLACATAAEERNDHEVAKRARTMALNLNKKK